MTSWTPPPGPTGPERPDLPPRPERPRRGEKPYAAPQGQPASHDQPPPYPPYAPYGQPAAPVRHRRTGASSWLVFLVALLAGAVGAAGAVVVVDLLTGGDERGGERSEERGAQEGAAAELPAAAAPGEEALAAAVSETREDSVYPEVGDPVVDALHYDVELSWFPEESDDLEGTTTVTFRATEDRDDFQLDLAENLTVSSVEVDGEDAGWEHSGKDLVVATPVVTDERYAVTVVYAGPPEPAEAPTTRSDFDGGVGITRSEGEHDGWLWTMQEPYGAYTWYPVNDQPADKALYDVTVRTQAGWTGVANGVVDATTETATENATRFHADAPMSSYLTTVAVGDYELTEDVSDSGVALTYWTPAGDDDALEALEGTKEALAYAEELLGPYPFSSLGAVVVDSESAMETQTMITYGNTDYTLSPATLVHEIAHHWYGNKVSPADWSDVWMNEGMATYVQMVWEAEEEYGVPLDEYAALYAEDNASLRAEAGPPAAYDPTTFAESNIYVIPAVMWHEVRLAVGDDAFWDMVRAWPAEAGEAFVSVDRAAYLPWVSQRLRRDLSAFFDAWLLQEAQPPITFG